MMQFVLRRPNKPSFTELLKSALYSRKVTPVGSHFTSCNHTREINDISKLVSCPRPVVRLMTLEGVVD